MIGYFTGKVLRLLIYPQKLRKFSTVNGLQYTVYVCMCVLYHSIAVCAFAGLCACLHACVYVHIYYVCVRLMYSRVPNL